MALRSQPLILKRPNSLACHVRSINPFSYPFSLSLRTPDFLPLFSPLSCCVRFSIFRASLCFPVSLFKHFAAILPLPSNCQSSRLALLSEARGKTHQSFMADHSVSSWTLSSRELISVIHCLSVVIPFAGDGWLLYGVWRFPTSLSIYGNNLIERYNALFWELKIL